MAVSPNFTFLGVHDAQLVKIGTLAERYFQDDPVTCLIKLRQFGELLAQLVAANVGLYTNPDESQLDLLNRLQSQNLIPGDVKNLFHQLRKSGNDAVHNLLGSHGLALSHLRYARELGIWFHRTFGRDSKFKPGAFIPPADPAQETKELRAELARLRKQAEASRSKAELAASKALEETELRKLAEELLEEAEALLEQRLNTIQSITVSKSSKLIQKTVTAANNAEQQIDLDENESRLLLINTNLIEDNLSEEKDNNFPEHNQDLQIIKPSSALAKTTLNSYQQTVDIHIQQDGKYHSSYKKRINFSVIIAVVSCILIAFGFVPYRIEQARIQKQERQEALRAEEARQAAIREQKAREAEQRRQAAEEAARKAEVERKERERLAAIKAEADRKEKERLAILEAERKEAEKKERERLAALEAEKVRKAAERKAALEAPKPWESKVIRSNSKNLEDVIRRGQ